MKTLVSAIEIGSVRALIPVCIELIQNGHQILIDRKGYFTVEIVEALESSFFDVPVNEDQLKQFMQDECIGTVLFSVNVRDTRPLRIARVAQSLGIKTVHLLDYSNDYRARMERDGLVMFQPTRYLVPDEHARQKSVEDGISSNLIKTCGQPAFANLEDLYKKASQHDNPFDSLIVNGFKVILFASEPVAQDHGSSLNENSNYRGYTEKEAILILINSIKVMDELIFVVVLPHPRQDVIELNKLWRACGGELYGKVQDGRLNKCDFFPFIYGVVGMASTLLYEAWLVGIPVLSIQPGLLNDSYRKLEEKEGIIFIDQYVGAEEKVVKWLTGLTDFSVQQSQAELELHKQASKRISEEVLSFHE